MKINFRKITALATSALMVGMTAGAAAAADYPSPFVTGSSGNFAVVYGATGADQAQATSIAEDLQSMVGSVSLGSDAFKLEKASTKYHLGDSLTDLYSSLDDDELEELLGDGVYVDDDNDEFDFTQKITLGALQLTMFEDNDYAEDEPTVGFRVPSGTTVLTYTLDFTDEPLIADLVTTDLTIMGKTYYVLSNSTSGDLVLTLLDSAEEATLMEGASTTVSGHTVSIDYVSATEVVLIIDGVATNSLGESDTQKLADGSYVGVKDIRFNSKEGTVSSVEFSIGSGKLKLTSGSDIEVNDDVVSGVSATITNTTTISSIAIAWAADDDLFITPTSSITLPSFESVQLSFTGLNYPKEETISAQRGGALYFELSDFPLKETEADIPLLYAATAGNFSGLGKDSDNQLVTAGGGANLTFDGDEDDWFVVTYNTTDEGESHLVRFTNFLLDGTNHEADLQEYKNGAWSTIKSGLQNNTDDVGVGQAEIKVYDIDKSAKTVIVGSGTSTNFNTLYSKEGLKVMLPYIANSTVEGAFDDFEDGGARTGHNGTSFYLVMREEDKNDDLAAGDWINLTVGWDGSSPAEPQVSAVDTSNTDATSIEIGDTDVFRDFTYSDLATEILFDKPSSGPDSVDLMYHGAEVTVDVYVTSTDASPDGTVDLGGVLVTDAEVSSVSSKNLVVVGGSCINTVAASLVGGSYCGAAWESATGVGTGKFLIQSFASPYSSSKVAVLVAGYEAAETAAGASRLVNLGGTIDTSVGNKYVGVVGSAGTSTVSKVA